MPSAPPAGIAERVRAALDAGRTRGEVIEDIVRSGLSRASAERFVDRVQSATRPTTAATAAPSPGHEGGRGALVSGAFWLSLGCTATGVSYLVAGPGEKFIVAYGAVIAGAAAFLRGLKRWREAATPFPLLAVLAAALLPPASVGALVGFAYGREHAAHEARRVAEEARLNKARAEQEDLRAALQREAADQARAQAHAERISRFRGSLRTSSHPMTVCEAALSLGAAGDRDSIPDLLAVLGSVRQLPSVRSCAAGALVKLGEVQPALSFYDECARASTTELWSIAAHGFADIGPEAAAAALPYLEEALRSPNVARRRVAVDSLGHLGAAAEAPLRLAARDSDPMVRERATAALAALGR